MITIKELKRRKEELRYSCRQIAELSGVPIGTVQKIFSGTTVNPQRETMLRLMNVLAEKEEGEISQGKGPQSNFTDNGLKNVPEKNTLTSYEATGRLTVREPAYAFGSSAFANVGGKKQGEYTVEDYLALPDDKRYELIDGVIYDMSSPTSNHQEIAGYLYYLLMQCTEAHEGSCRPYIGPLDVQLDKEQPDNAAAGCHCHL